MSTIAGAPAAVVEASDIWPSCGGFASVPDWAAEVPVPAATANRMEAIRRCMTAEEP
jgi:hypothetical protein